MQVEPEYKPIKPEGLVSKSDTELLQLKRYYELKIQEEKKYHPFRKIRKYFLTNRSRYIGIFLTGILLLLLFFYLGAKHNPYYGIPAALIFGCTVFFGFILDTTKIDNYWRNIETCDILIKARQDIRENKSTRSAVSQKAMLIYEIIKKEGEVNLTVLIKKLKDKGTPMTEKTVRKYIREDLRDLVEKKTAEYSSTSRRMKNAKVYFLKSIT